MSKITKKEIDYINNINMIDIFEALNFYHKIIVDGDTTYYHVSYKNKSYDIYFNNNVWNIPKMPKKENEPGRTGVINLISYITKLDFYKTVRLIRLNFNNYK